MKIEFDILNHEHYERLHEYLKKHECERQEGEPFVLLKNV